jgi:hypothetical protein
MNMFLRVEAGFSIQQCPSVCRVSLRIMNQVGVGRRREIGFVAEINNVYLPPNQIVRFTDNHDRKRLCIIQYSPVD